MFFSAKERFFTDKLFSLKWFKSYLFIVFGSFIMAGGYSFFAEPHKIIPGGVYGIAIVLHHVFGFMTGVTGFAINIPLFIIGIWILGPRFGTKTFVGTVLTSFFIDLQKSFGWGTPTDDLMLASVVSGVLIGAGLALIFKSKATTGGSDIIAQIVNKYTKISLGKLLIFIDSAVVVVGVLVFKDFSLAIYALITIYLCGKVIDVILLGSDNRKAVFVISDEPEKIKNFIIKRLNRGGTFFYGEGIYEEKEKRIVYSVLSRRELAALQDYVAEIDMEAFMSVFDTNQVYGKGFVPLEEN